MKSTKIIYIIAIVLILTQQANMVKLKTINNLSKDNRLE